MKRAIVTGATGFIGSWLVQELINNGVEVTVIVRDKRKFLHNLHNHQLVTIIEKQIESLQICDFKTEFYDAFFHLAWSGVNPENKNDVALQIQNIQMSLHTLEIAHKLGCKKYIATGTVAEFTQCDGVMDVNGRHTPNDIYGATKVATFYFLKIRSQQLGQDFNWLILPSTYGPRRTDNNIITYTIKTFLNGQTPKYGSLTQMWDFLFVSDVARAIRLVAEKGKKNKVYGIGSSQYRPLKSYVEDIRDMIDPDLKLNTSEQKIGNKDTCSSCVNIYDITKDTGFQPSVSFADGIKVTIDAFLQEQK